jgi:hypothetical protein
MVYGGYAAPFSIARDNVPGESTSKCGLAIRSVSGGEVAGWT